MRHRGAGSDNSERLPDSAIASCRELDSCGATSVASEGEVKPGGSVVAHTKCCAVCRVATSPPQWRGEAVYNITTFLPPSSKNVGAKGARHFSVVSRLARVDVRGVSHWRCQSSDTAT